MTIAGVRNRSPRKPFAGQRRSAVGHSRCIVRPRPLWSWAGIVAILIGQTLVRSRTITIMSQNCTRVW
jgi:hypothetical protein